jgi:hypothetical protein
MGQQTAERLRAALRTEEQKLKTILDAIENADVDVPAVAEEIRRVEEGLRKIRRAA